MFVLARLTDQPQQGVIPMTQEDLSYKRCKRCEIIFSSSYKGCPGCMSGGADHAYVKQGRVYYILGCCIESISLFELQMKCKKMEIEVESKDEFIQKYLDPIFGVSYHTEDHPKGEA